MSFPGCPRKCPYVSLCVDVAIPFSPPIPQTLQVTRYTPPLISCNVHIFRTSLVPGFRLAGIGIPAKFDQCDFRKPGVHLLPCHWAALLAPLQADRPVPQPPSTKIRFARPEGFSLNLRAFFLFKEIRRGSVIFGSNTPTLELFGVIE